MLQSEVLQDIEIKEFELIKFDLEALMRLEHWNDLDKTLSVSSSSRLKNIRLTMSRCVSAPVTQTDSKAPQT